MRAPPSAIGAVPVAMGEVAFVFMPISMVSAPGGDNLAVSNTTSR